MPAPTIVSVNEQPVFGPDRKLSKQLVIKYMVGSDGPFTLATTETDLASGAAMLKMQQFANTLTTLPRG